MTRAEFSKSTKREALKRSGGHCEATGALYGLPAGQRCNAILAYGVEFDHELAASNGGDASLENCRAVCTRCHAYKTTRHDTPRAAKIVRQRDKATGIAKPKRSKWMSDRYLQKLDGSVYDRRTGERVR